MKKLIIKLVKRWGFLVLEPTEFKTVFLDDNGQKWTVFKK